VSRCGNSDVVPAGQGGAHWALDQDDGDDLYGRSGSEEQEGEAGGVVQGRLRRPVDWQRPLVVREVGVQVADTSAQDAAAAARAEVEQLRHQLARVTGGLAVGWWNRWWHQR
jgi:hypothetical protein